MSVHHPLKYVEDSSLCGSISRLSKSMEWYHCPMMVSSIPETSSLSARCWVSVGNTNIWRMSPSSLILPKTLCVVPSLPKVLTLTGSMSGATYCEKYLIIFQSRGLSGGIPPCSETSRPRVGCICEWTDFSFPSLHK